MQKSLTLPNMITVVRIALVVPFVALMTCGQYGWALMCFVLAAVSDFVDGCLARKTQTVTTLGKFLDPLADKMLVDAALVLLAVVGVWPAWVIIVMLCRDFMVDGIRMMAAQQGEVIAASWLGKSKTVAQMVALIAGLAWLTWRVDLGVAVHNYLVGVEILLIFAMFLSVISGIEYLYQGRRFLR